MVLNLGLSGLYTYEKLFISGIISFGGHLQDQIFSGSEIKDKVITGVSTTALLDAGYDSKTWGSIGLQTRVRSIQIPVQNAKFDQARTITSVYYKYFFLVVSPFHLNSRNVNITGD